MALNRMRVVFAVLGAVVVFPAIAFSTQYIVGDDAGWTLNFDYAAWAAGKTFFVGDTLVFNYEYRSHNVIKVNGTGFASCIKSPNSGVLTTGSDAVTLATPGNKWYICGVAEHCSSFGQKLKITVWPKMMMWAPTPAPAPASPLVAHPCGHQQCAAEVDVVDSNTVEAPAPPPWSSPEAPWNFLEAPWSP